MDGSSPGTFRVGIDIGGTFTDFTVIGDDGSVSLWKQATTSDDPSRAIAEGLEWVAAGLRLKTPEFLERVSLLVHGTTAGTNAVIQRNGPKVGLLATEGFRDILYFRDAFKPERFNIHLEHPGGFVERNLRLGAVERIAPDGEVVTPLDEASVRAAAETFRAEGVRAVAVAFLWSVVNPAHERRAAEILREELGDVDVLCSSDILPEVGEWERTSSTVLSAYILPVIKAYMRKVEDHLSGLGLAHPLLIMQINGGCASVDEVLRRPVNAVHSGPAAAPAAAAWYARELGEDDLITVDMGGTSLDVCVIVGGQAGMSRKLQVESQPIGVPGVDVHSIGAGGGSIAWVDNGGALRVGPRSAGATPGPAAYGAGGTEPTVTDAHVALGRLAPEAFLGGQRKLHDDRSRDAVERAVGEPLGLDLIAAAGGILRVVNANMVGAVRAVSVERGIDPRGFTLVCGGGAGGLHAASLARAIGMKRVLIPREAGTFCAFGMTVTDVRHDHSRALHAVSSDERFEEVDAAFAEMEAEARERLEASGFGPDQIEIQRSVDARYVGQVHEITIPVPPAEAYGPTQMREIEERFNAEHRRHFTYAREGLPIEFLHWRVTGVGRIPETRQPAPARGDGRALVPAGTRGVWFEEVDAVVETAVHWMEALSPGDRISGPAIVQSSTTTIAVNPGDVLSVLDNGSYAIDVDIESAAAAQLTTTTTTGANR
ncbi:hydantoinase/oxoprolinase family protein [Conexibacter arvalis]|uniref:N-methylhydantoinase A n=1 Tax=Conexibacter arvalis TaxID=912552 RepID=A0A840IK49_9ACTN|nr:N-methylhydantoinase A [Conexibacter arvalis]